MITFSNKIISVICFVAIAVTSIGSLQRTNALDTFLLSAEKLAKNGVIDIPPTEAGFMLDKNISRAEMAKIAVKLRGNDVIGCSGNVYVDVTGSLGDLCSYLEIAASGGIISLAHTTFRPYDTISRAEMVKMLLAAKDISPSVVKAGFSDVSPSLGDLEGFINAGVKEGCIGTGTTFRPNDFATRGEVFKVAACVAEQGNILLHPPIADKWGLVWSDEFSGSTLDSTKWTLETGTGIWGNNELQNYTASGNLTVNNGELTIEARKENVGGAFYSSARIVTHKKASWVYGKVEARMKLPYGKGIWPAFWMLGENIDTVGYPKSGEIDIMEMIGGKSPDMTNNDGIIWGSLHRPNLDPHPDDEVKSQTASYINGTGANFSDDFHIFGIEWSPKIIRYYVDGNIYKSVDISKKIDGFEVFQKPFYIVLNVAVGGDFPGDPDATTVWPQKMVVDWVHVYQKSTFSFQRAK